MDLVACQIILSAAGLQFHISPAGVSPGLHQVYEAVVPPQSQLRIGAQYHPSLMRLTQEMAQHKREVHGARSVCMCVCEGGVAE